MEIWDMEPTDWPEAAIKPFADVISDPAAWAKKCIETYGAEMIVLQLKSADPNDKDASPEDVAINVKKVLNAIDVPLIIWGTANVQKDEDVLKKISEECDGENLIIGPVEDKNHKGIGASAMGYGHTIISSSPIDVNLAKQVNILLKNLGVPMDKIIVDPTTGGLGYGLEYSYSVMERLRMAALSQGDDKLQLPLINNLGNEVWKCKEAKQTVEEAPGLGDPERRGILMEAVGAVVYLMGGSDVLIMRHPEAIRLARAFIDLLLDGGSANDVASIEKQLDDIDIDYAAIAPELDLSIEEEKKAVSKKKEKLAPKKGAPEKVAKPEIRKEAPKVASKPTEKVSKETSKVDAETEVKAKAEAEAKAKEDAKLKAEADASAKREDEADAIRQKRLEKREKLAAKRESAPAEAVSMTPAKEPKDKLEKMLEKLNMIYKR
mmetsp:Transcript_22490/g.10823  ORF Transcript_22490/g.10823 Transcript_22490/m.10823 type:complete len:435 (+) Transcript_22490:540-1844(+)